ncbi:MAG: hypothetical protein MN733_29565, partial [Nitrososphaera sp.]|nr:hypothetical protein [Nitrososphaera sp.]
IHFPRRLYLPSRGLFSQVDPLKRGRRFYSSRANYSYVDSRPITRVDPRGLIDYTYDKDNCHADISVKIYMQFGAVAKGLAPWGEAEKLQWLSDFRKAVEDFYSGKCKICPKLQAYPPYQSCGKVGRLIYHLFCPCPQCFTLRVHVNYVYSSGESDYDATVSKIPKGAFEESETRTLTGGATLDTEDVVPTDKGASVGQRGAVHEFGHMLGLGDEYGDWTRLRGDNGDTESIMNKGESLRDRHCAEIAKKLLNKLGNDFGGCNWSSKLT